eukprot:12695271-Alexandrium_andersonii.AAC.1
MLCLRTVRRARGRRGRAGGRTGGRCAADRVGRSSGGGDAVRVTADAFETCGSVGAPGVAQPPCGDARGPETVYLTDESSECQVFARFDDQAKYLRATARDGPCWDWVFCRETYDAD